MLRIWRPGRECLQAIRMNSEITIGLAFKRFPFPCTNSKFPWLRRSTDRGLVTEVVEPETCLDRALDIADRIAANPGHSTRLAKRLLREGQDMKLGPLLELSAAYQALAHHTADHIEAVDAFIAKRRPVWADELSQTQFRARD